MSGLACPLCGHGEDFRELEASEPPYRVLACPVCDYGFVHPLPSRERLARAYGEAYYEPWRNEDVAARRRMWAWRLRRVREACPSGRLLEVGAGDGDFLELAAGAGFETAATEFSDAAAANLRRRVPGADIRQGEIEEMDWPAGTFDVVVAWHSLEHMRRPFAALAAMHAALRPGGVLMIAVPNRHNHLMRLFYRLARGRAYPLFSLHTKEIHLSHFTPASLRRAVEQAGFAVRAIEPDRAMVEPAKRVIDALARLGYRLSGHLGTEAMLLTAHRSEDDKDGKA